MMREVEFPEGLKHLGCLPQYPVLVEHSRLQERDLMNLIVGLVIIFSSFFHLSKYLLRWILKSLVNLGSHPLKRRYALKCRSAILPLPML
jgi:hypothetical protein